MDVQVMGVLESVADVLGENAVRSSRHNSEMCMLICDIADKLSNVEGNELHRRFGIARERRGWVW